MGNELFKEPFVGKYDGVTSPLLLPVGGISDGLNMRKVSPIGGWKPRKGSTLHNTTALTITNGGVASLHTYKHPKNEDYHFISQCNKLLYEASNNPPTAGTTFGTSLGVAVNDTSGFSCMVNDYFIYCDGGGPPICYGGDTPFPLAFLSKNAESEKGCMDHTKVIIDQDDETYGIVRSAANQTVFIVTYEPISEAHLEFYSGKENDAAATLTVEAMRSGTWTAVSDLVDGTDVSGDSMKTNGTISWTASSLDTPYVIDRRMGYCYKLTWNATLDEIGISKCTVTQAAHTVTNKWNGAYESVAGFYFYDASADTKLLDGLGYITSPSTSMYMDVSLGQTGDFLYMGTPEPAAGYFIGVVKGYENDSGAGNFDLFEYFDGNVWQDKTIKADNTLTDDGESLGVSGSVLFDPSGLSIEWQPSSFGLDRTPLYWGRLSWDAALSDDTWIYYVTYIPNPIPLGTYDGCVEFKGRLILWGDRMFPNRLRYSSLDRQDGFSGLDSGYSQAFGGMDYIKCSLNFYNELLIWKENSVWMWEGFDGVTFGSLRITDSVGLASPKTAAVVEVGTPGMSTEEPRSIAIWQDTDGVYVLDGRKPKKVSMPIDWLFNPEYTSCIAAADINSLQSFTDPLRNTYHLLLPTAVTLNGESVTEVVYNYATDEWYPPWYRNMQLSCAKSFKSDRSETGGGRDEVYGGTSTGYILRLENDTSDKNTSNEDVPIEHRLKTRAISALQDRSSTWKFDVMQLWPEFKARTVGAPTVSIYPDLATSGTSLGTASMINSGYTLANPLVSASTYCQGCFQADFSLNTIDYEMEIWSLSYALSIRGLPNK